MSQNLFRSSTNEGSLSLVSPRASQGSFQQPAAHRQSNYVASFEPLPRSSIAPGPAHMSVDENIPPDQHRQSSQYQGIHIPPTANLPPLGGIGPGHSANMPPPPVPPRRSSMQDASNEFLRATYPQALPLLPQDPVSRVPSPRTFTPPRFRRNGKGKERALEPHHPAPPHHPPPPAGEVVGPCR